LKINEKHIKSSLYFDHYPEKGLIEGEIRGIEKGKFEEKLETAWKLKQKGFPVEMICEITGLSADHFI
jgi:predicted transposase/invertase (TIGR01784 family)